VTAFAAISQFTAIISVVMMLGLSRDATTNELDYGREVWNLSARLMSLLMLSALIGITLGHAAYFVSIARLGVSTTSGVLQLQPFCVAIAQFAIDRKLMTPGQWGSGTVAVIGALVLLYAQWSLTRMLHRSAAANGQGVSPPVAGAESEGIEAAEMDAMPVRSDGVRDQGTASSADPDSGQNRRQMK
jgi:drug/metabolite transporter (DMT)-like permease